MYPEFIAIYIGLAILAVLQIVVLLCLRKLLKQSEGGKQMPHPYTAPQTSTFDPGSAASSVPISTAPGAIVFCKHCAAEFDAGLKACPKCGTPR